jgi:hypothetical protein
MKQLARLQHIFQDCVLHPGEAESTAWISASGRAAPEIQLFTYKHAYAARLREVLANDYPATLMALGDKLFDRLADDYIREYPSHYFSLRDFGSQLPGFVSDPTHEQTRYRDMPWLFELTLFEWTLGEAFDAADGPMLGEQALAAVAPEDWPSLRFIVHPSVQRLDLEWNVPEIWRALTGDPPTQVIAGREAAGPWLIWREQLITRFRSMPRDEQQALDTIRDGKHFDALCEVLATQMDEADVPLRAAALLKGWIAQDLISAIQ